jgi:uncharacterized protein YbgA (DUF1722 family)/uncharacterized protein YbbK (DUF523 family)
LVLSKCLEIDACRYNGQLIRAPFVLSLMPFVDLKPVCPEVEIGLGIPRDPIRLVRLGSSVSLVQPTTGRDVTADMQAFNDSYLSGLGEVDGFILKSRSPSCGIKDTKIYAGEDGKQPSDKGPGMFGGAVLERFPLAAVEDEGRLTNFRLRHHFLTKLFTRAAFRELEARPSMAALVQFHAENKLLLMAYHQSELRALGRIVANPDRRPIDAVLADYEVHLAHALERPPRNTSNINVLQHALGYVSDGLTAAEKRHFLEALDEYRARRMSLSPPLLLVQSWIARFEESYLAQQSYFEPYPAELMDLRDSAREN